MQKLINVVHKRPAMPAEVVTIKNTLEALQGLLDGGCLCVIRITSKIHGYVDDEGLLKELPLNFMHGDEPIVGPAIFSRADASGDDIGFPDDEAIEFCKFINTLGSP